MNRTSASIPSSWPYDEAASTFAALRGDRCDWCSSPYHEIYRADLCRHCYEIRNEKKRLVQKVRGKMGAGLRWRALELGLRIDCHTAGRREDFARAEGELIAEDRGPDNSSMTVERLLTDISHEILPPKERDLYGGYAATISSLFSPAQRAALIHLLARVVDLRTRHSDRKRAKADSAKTVEDSQKMPTWLAEALGG